MFKFGFFKDRRARAVVQNTMPSLPEGVQLLGPVERAATLALANAMLEAGADAWGPGVLRNPSALARPVAVEAVLVLAGHHGKLRLALEGMQRRNMDDIAYSQTMRELRATEVLIGTLGAVLVDGRKPPVNEAWKLLWGAREHALEGAKALADFARHAKVPPVPRAKARPGKLKAADLVQLASSLPPFLQRRPSRPAPATPRKPGPGRALPTPVRSDGKPGARR